MNDDNMAARLARNYSGDIDLLKRIIDAIPANVFFKDTDCKYQVVSHVCDLLNRREEGWTIIGKTDLEVQYDQALAKFYYEDDRKIIETRQGNRYTSEMEFYGEKYYYDIIKEPVIDESGEVIGVIGLVNDVTELVRLQEKLRIISITDHLTGVYNRTYFEQKIAELESGNSGPVSVIMCDANGLKFFNDNFGHPAGDALLKETVALIQDTVGDEGEVMRIGGDEFVIFCPGSSEDAGKSLVERLREQEKERRVGGLPISNSYGVATAATGNKIRAAFMAADRMMYAEKANAKEAYIRMLTEQLEEKP
jgi:diguanylate cyclase (GGDEF)-like protein